VLSIETSFNPFPCPLPAKREVDEGKFFVYSIQNYTSLYAKGFELSSFF
jgi:hypothetical protein